MEKLEPMPCLRFFSRTRSVYDFDLTVPMAGVMAPPKDVHALIPRTYDHAALRAKELSRWDSLKATFQMGETVLSHLEGSL